MNHLWREWRSGRISDPVAKLRYLRRAAAVRPRSRSFSVAMGVAALLAVSVPNASAPPIDGAGKRPFADRTPVWLVEARDGVETFSNGLRIDNRYQTRAAPRPSSPVGIVFHTTESQMEPFDPQHHKRLKLLGESLLEYVRDHAAYHFVVDRFGRVYRIAPESGMANHAGHSVWASGDKTYVDLNNSFLGISVETQTRPGDEYPAVMPAQLIALRTVTAYLRSKYAIAPENCVTHAQVSVNPSNWQVGYHTDWAANFPFEEIGLPDNYRLPLAAITRFGFTWDASYFAATGTRLWAGVVAAEDHLRSQAATLGVSPASWRQTLRKNYPRTEQKK